MKPSIGLGITHENTARILLGYEFERLDSIGKSYIRAAAERLLLASAFERATREMLSKEAFEILMRRALEYYPQLFTTTFRLANPRPLSNYDELKEGKLIKFPGSKESNDEN